MKAKKDLTFQSLLRLSFAFWVGQILPYFPAGKYAGCGCRIRAGKR